MSDEAEHDVAGLMGREFWDAHWQERGDAGPGVLAHPYLERETGALTPGSALDAGCGEGAETVWLASRGWSVTAADIAPEALARTARRCTRAGVAERVQLVEADLGAWEPAAPFDLVTTHYAHPAMPQLAFYERLSRWVRPGGTLLVVGHLSTTETGHGHSHSHSHGQPPQPPQLATVTAASVIATLDPARWHVVTAVEETRTLDRSDGAPVALHDVVVRAARVS